MKKLIFLVLLTITCLSWAMTDAEEAIILNQELEFLQDSIDKVELKSEKTKPTAEITNSKPIRTLEETYFNDINDDEVSTRASSRKRDLE